VWREPALGLDAAPPLARDPRAQAAGRGLASDAMIHGARGGLALALLLGLATIYDLPRWFQARSRSWRSC
jgi:hypothetical protein